MGNAASQYNPFSVYGEYNLKKTAYENKKSFIGVLSFALLIIIGTITVLYVTGDNSIKPVRKFNILPPKHGLGPYGVGLYLPPISTIL